MKKIMAVMALLAAAFVQQLHAQNLVYDANAEVRKVESFHGIEVAGGISVYISQGSVQAVAVSADDEKNVSKIKTEVKNGTLSIYVDAKMWNGWNWGNKKIKAYITVTDLDHLELSGGSVCKITDEIKTDEMDVELHGGSIINGKLSGNKLQMELSGGSIANMDAGSFSDATVDASGGSILKAYDVDLETCKVDASGGSIINITCNKEMSADASGGSIINYKGGGVIKSIDSSGGSIVKKKD